MLPVVTMVVNVLVSVGQFQRDLQNELTRDGLAAARAAGKTLGRPPHLAQADAVDNVRRAYRNGASIAALARRHHVIRAAIRTALADLLPDRPTHPTPTTPTPAHVEIPGQIASLLTDHPDLCPAERTALTHARTTRRGRGYCLTVTAPADIHQRVLEAATAVIGADSAPATRKAYRTCAQRVADLALLSAIERSPNTVKAYAHDLKDLQPVTLTVSRRFPWAPQAGQSSPGATTRQASTV